MTSSTPSSAKRKRFPLTIRDIALVGMMTATLEVVKVALLFLPNIELVTLLIMLYTYFFGYRALLAVFCWIFVEMVLYGPGLWWIMYLYIWPLLYLTVWLIHRFLRKASSSDSGASTARSSSPANYHVFLYTIVAGFYGLTFGAVCAIPYFFIGGWTMAFTWWVAGIPYDLLHFVGNVVGCLLLWKPLNLLLCRLTVQLNLHND